MERKGIIAAGNWIIDQVKIIDQYPQQDALANILNFTLNNGGSPYNLLKDLNRLQTPFPLEAIGLVGNDEKGDIIRKDCQNNKINTDQLHKTNETSTSYTDVMTVKSTGRRTFFHQRGANALFNREHINFEKSNAKIFHLGYLLLLDGLDQIDEKGRTQASYVLEEAIERGMKTSVDVVSESSDRFEKIIPPALPYVDYLFLNEYEAEKVTGINIVNNGKVDIFAAKRATSRLIEMGVRSWVIMHFHQGAVACDNRQETYIQPGVRVPAEHIKGAAGAGDAFAAGVLLGMHENMEIFECLKTGVCAAATCLFEANCSDGILPYEEVIKTGEDFGFESL